MNRSAIPLSCLSVALLGLTACTAPTPSETAATASPANAAMPSDAELLARGEYLVRIAGCNDCHTPGYGPAAGEIPKAQWLVGDRTGFSGPWGTTYPANLRLKVASMDEAGWLKYTGELHTRPIMPDFNVRAMKEQDRQAIYRFIRSLGPAGEVAPAYLPPGQKPPLPYWNLMLPPGPPTPAPAPAPAPAQAPAPAAG